jgi:hypothetical protein
MLVEVGRCLGSYQSGCYQWLLRVSDLSKFLKKLSPIFSKRLVASEFANITQTLILNLYKESYVLHFKKGCLVSVERNGFIDSSMGQDGGDLCIPRDAFIRLLFGYRSLDELFDAWPDILIKDEVRKIIMTLFPSMKSFLCTPYGYWGSLDQ